jgi:signal transduction histidine kinase
LAFHARSDRKVLAGVAGGFADQHGVDPTLVRAALVVLSLAGGLGIVLYAVGAVLAGRDTPVAAPLPRSPQRNASVAAITVGLLSVVRSTGLWLGDTLMVPVVVLAAGFSVLALARPDIGERPWDALPGQALSASGGRWLTARVISGAVLIAIGLVLVGTVDVGSVGAVNNSVRAGAFATALTVLGIGLVLGPWLAKLAQSAADERRQRIRADERAAMAAHLHDSVLQTLALIQRTADDPRRTVTLARRQERELREWLFGEGGVATRAGSFATALRDIAADVEDGYDVRVDVVVVGDHAVTATVEALLGAAREACLNAAKHSGENEMSVYAEVTAEAIEVYVRDRGHGFDRSAVEADRRGIAESIEARLHRVGGTATIDTSPSSGTEVTLRVPVEVPA